MNDAELRIMAGRAIGLNENELKYFDPFHSYRQTMEVASVLRLNVSVDFINKQTLVTRFEKDGSAVSMLVEEHAQHNGRIDLANVYAILRVAAAIGVIEPVEIAPCSVNPKRIKTVKRTPNFKHGRRVTPAPKQSDAATETVVQ